MIEMLRGSRVMLILAAMLLVGALATTGLVIAQRVASIPDEVRELPGDNGVVHIIAQQSIDSASTENRYEAWIDAAGDRAKQVYYDADGNPVLEVVVDGKERIVFNFQDGVASRRLGTSSDDPIIRSIMVDLWYIGASHRLGHAEVLEETKIDGVPATKVSLPVSGPASSVVASLDNATLLPLEEEYFDSDGQLVATRSTRYSLVETLDAVGPALFVSSADTDKVYETRTRMTLSQARDFHRFDIYYTGESVGNDKVFWIQHDERFSVYPQQGSLNAVLIHYTPEGAAPRHGTESTTIVRSERALPEDVKEWDKKGRDIQEDVVRQLGENDFRLELFKGNVLVTLRGSSESELATMREQLVKLN